MKPLSLLLEAERRVSLGLEDSRVKWTFQSRRSSAAPDKPDKTKKLMVLMINTQLGRCVLCGRELILDTSLRSDHPDRPSFDHVVPRAKRGQDRGNRIAFHRQCNSLKSDRDPTGCELIWLDVVNLAIQQQSYLFQDKRVKKGISHEEKQRPQVSH